MTTWKDEKGNTCYGVKHVNDNVNKKSATKKTDKK